MDSGHNSERITAPNLIHVGDSAQESKTAGLIEASNSTYSGEVCEFAPAGSIEVTFFYGTYPFVFLPARHIIICALDSIQYFFEVTSLHQCNVRVITFSQNILHNRCQ